VGGTLKANNHLLCPYLLKRKIKTFIQEILHISQDQQRDNVLYGRSIGLYRVNVTVISTSYEIGFRKPWEGI
jgi:hypothetical protein